MKVVRDFDVLALRWVRHLNQISVGVRLQLAIIAAGWCLPLYLNICRRYNTVALFSYVAPESFVPKDHPLRAIRKMADGALAGLLETNEPLHNPAMAHDFI